MAVTAGVWPGTTGHEHVPFGRIIPFRASTPALSGEAAGLGRETLEFGNAGMSLGF